MNRQSSAEGAHREQPMWARQRAVMRVAAWLLLGIFALYPLGAEAASLQDTVWAVDRLDDPALPAGNECTAAANDCSLRGAVSRAVAGDTVQLTVPGTIVLVQGQIEITQSITITSPGLVEHVIDGDEQFRIFSIGESAEVILDQLTLQNGLGAPGGAVLVQGGVLTATNVLMQNNRTAEVGGALFVRTGGEAMTQVHLDEVQFLNNYAEADFQSGGAVAISAVGYLFAINEDINPRVEVQIKNSLFENNRGGGEGDGYGGAISANALDSTSFVDLQIDATRFYSNSTDYQGGAIYAASYARADVASTVAVTIRNSEFEKNRSGVAGGSGGQGGAIYFQALENFSTVEYLIVGSTFTGNEARNGGSVGMLSYNRGTGDFTRIQGEIVRSQFIENNATVGGAIYLESLDSHSELQTAIVDSAFLTNTVGEFGGGGGIYFTVGNRDSVGMTTGRLGIAGTTFAHNRANESNGGALYLATNARFDAGTDARTEIMNSTFSDNLSTEAGGMLFVSTSGVTTTTSTIELVNVTGYNNSTVENTDISHFVGGTATASFTLRNSLLAGSTGAACDSFRLLPEGANNLIFDTSCGDAAPFYLGAPVGIVPQLADNGGPAWTHSLYAGSNALNAVPADACTDADGASLLVDQRGELRPFGDACDIGALEAQTDQLPANPNPEPEPDPDPGYTFRTYLPALAR